MKKTSIIIIIAVLVVAAIGIGVFYGMQGGEPPRPQYTDGRIYPLEKYDFVVSEKWSVLLVNANDTKMALLQKDCGMLEKYKSDLYIMPLADGAHKVQSGTMLIYKGKELVEVVPYETIYMTNGIFSKSFVEIEHDGFEGREEE